MQSFPERLDQYRVQSGESERQLSEALGRHATYWVRAMRGIFLISEPVLGQFCQHYQVPPSERDALFRERAHLAGLSFTDAPRPCRLRSYVCHFCHRTLESSSQPRAWRVRDGMLHCPKPACTQQAITAQYKLLAQKKKARRQAGLVPPSLPRDRSSERLTTYDAADYGYGIEGIRAKPVQLPIGGSHYPAGPRRAVVRIVRHG